MLTIKQIQSAILAHGGAWQASETAIFRRRGTQRSNGLFGLRVDSTVHFRMADNALEDDVGESPPKHVDWRERNFEAILPVKDQGDCGACVAFATCAVLESSSAIQFNSKLILSEGHLFHCNGGSCEDGWGLVSGLEAARGGVGLNYDLPWSPASGCKEIKPRVAVKGFRGRSTPKDRRRAVDEGPVLAGMRVFEDFLAYDSGIYRHLLGEEVGQHAVCVVGYDDAQSCWIVKNSWSDQFGEEGFFRINYGECGLDSEFSFFSAEISLISEVVTS